MKTMAIAAPGDPRCGIRDYADFLGQALQHEWHVVALELPDGTAAKAWRDAAARADAADLVLVHYEYGLFHSVRPYRNIFALFMKRLLPPAIVILHDLLPEYTPRWRERALHPYRLYDALRDLAYLPFFAAWTRDNYGLADHFIVHVPQMRDRVRNRAPGAGISFFLHPVPATSGHWHIGKPKQYTFISPGFIKAHKGYLEFLEVVNSRRDWTWLLAGGPQNDADREFADLLHGRIGDMGLEGRVTISGYLSRRELEQQMISAELAVFPYRQATGSGAAAWAVGMGMPILATGLDSFTALAEDGAGLFLVPGGKPEQWPELAAGLLDDRARQEQLALRNAAFSARHSYETLAGRITEIGAALLCRKDDGGRDRR